MPFSWVSLRVVERTDFDRKWNQLIQELQRRVITATTPLLVQDGISGGINISMIRPSARSAAAQVAIVKLTGNAAGGGKYNGRICTGTITIDGTGNLAMPEDLEVPDDDDALILNLEEDGQGTHWLKLDSFAFGMVVGTVDESDPQITIVEIPTGTPRVASPQVIGSSSEGSETADNASWLRTAVGSGSAYGNTPIELWMISRVVYNDAGDKVLYAMARKLTFTTDGKCHAVSAETRISVDVTGTCP